MNSVAGGMATDFVAMWRGACPKVYAHEDEGMPPYVSKEGNASR
jgi:hypothetical protein